MKPLNPKAKQALPGPSSNDWPDVGVDLKSARHMARAWSATVPERQRQQAAWSFIRTAIDAFVSVFSAAGKPFHVTPPDIALGFVLDDPVTNLAHVVGRHCAALPIAQACYQLSATYTALVPDPVRSALGMYYTP